MPLYEYRCSNCGNVFEKIQSFNAPEHLECPKCAGRSERLLSAPAIQFKGSGFYLTDYGKAGGSKGGAKEGGSGSESKPGSDSKGGGETKSAPAAAPTSTPSSGGTSGSGSAPASS